MAQLLQSSVSPKTNFAVAIPQLGTRGKTGGVEALARKRLSVQHSSLDKPISISGFGSGVPPSPPFGGIPSFRAGGGGVFAAGNGAGVFGMKAASGDDRNATAATEGDSRGNSARGIPPHGRAAEVEIVSARGLNISEHRESKDSISVNSELNDAISYIKQKVTNN